MWIKETFLTDAFLNIDGYNFYRRDRGVRHGGGIIVYILKKWNVQRRNDIEDANIETIWLEVSFPKTKPLLLCYIYRPPNAHVSWFHYFNIELERATTFNHDIILTGDFNIDILSSHKSYTAERLNDMMQLNNLTEIVKEHTRVTDISHTFIDHMYVNNVSHLQEVKVPRMTISDHYAVCMTWKKQNINSDKCRSNNNFITYRV